MSSLFWVYFYDCICEWKIQYIFEGEYKKKQQVKLATYILSLDEFFADGNSVGIHEVD